MPRSRNRVPYAELFDPSDTMAGRSFPSDGFCADLYIDDPPPEKRLRIIRAVINPIPKPVIRQASRDGILPRRLASPGTEPNLPSETAAQPSQQFPSTPLPGSGTTPLVRCRLVRANSPVHMRRRPSSDWCSADRRALLLMSPAFVGLGLFAEGGLSFQALTCYYGRPRG